MIESTAKAQEYFKLDPRTCVLTLAKSLTLDPDNTNPYQVGTSGSKGEKSGPVLRANRKINLTRSFCFLSVMGCSTINTIESRQYMQYNISIRLNGFNDDLSVTLQTKA